MAVEYLPNVDGDRRANLDNLPSIIAVANETHRWPRGMKNLNERYGTYVLRTVFGTISICGILSLCTFVLAISGLVFADEPPSAVGPVLKLFKSGKVPPERQGTVLEMICSRGNEHDLAVVFEHLMKADASVDLKLKMIGWLVDAANTRKTKPSGDLSSSDRLLSDSDVRVKQAAMKLASAWQLSSAFPSVRSIAVDSTTAPKLRKSAIEALVAIGGEQSKDTLLELAKSTHDYDTRVVAIIAMTGLDIDTACIQVAELLSQSKGNEPIQELITAVLENKSGSDKLAKAVEQSKLPIDVAKSALRFMYSIGRSDPSLSDVLSRAAGVATDPPPPSQEEVAKLAEQVIAKGDAARGEAVFRRSELSCLKCHSIHRAGGQVGPDLSAIGVSSPVDYVINSILNPNLAVKEQYVNTIFLMADGKVLNGVILDRDNDRVIIRDSQGKSIKLATADIEDEKEGKSQMPQGLTKFLTQDEVIDLAKFVSELGKPGAFAPPKKPCIQRWQYLKEPALELTQEVPHLENVRGLILGSSEEAWASLYSRVSGGLPLNELPNSQGMKVFYLQGEIQINEPGPISIHIASSQKFHAWLDDQPQESRKEIEANLTQGRHKLILRLEMSGGVADDLKVEVTKPAASTAQFELVGGP